MPSSRMSRREQDMTPTPTQPDSFTTILKLEESAEEVFAAVLNVRGWWSGRQDRREPNGGSR